MKYRSKANPRVTIEAMRLPKAHEDASEALIVFIGDLGDNALSGRDGCLDILTDGVEPDDDGWTSVHPEEWVLRDANGFLSRATNEQFEAEWEPIE